MKKKVVLVALLIIIILAGSILVQGRALPSKVYNSIMKFDYRPVLGKDKKSILENINLAKENLANLPERCNTDDNLQKLITKKEQKVKELSLKNFVYEINPLKKEVFFLNKKINSLNKKCEGKEEEFSYDSQETYQIDENSFTTTIELQDGQENNFVKIENNGETAITPHLIINDLELTSMRSIANNIISEEMTDKEKALAIWSFVKDGKYSFRNPTAYVERDSIDLFHSWGYGNCGVTVRSIIDLAMIAEIPAREHRLGGHIVPELYFENGWHVLDGDGAVYYTEDNGDIASVEDISNDLSLLEKFPSSVYSYEYLERAYKSKDNNVVFPYEPRNIAKKVEYTLRPHESVLFLDINQGDYFSAVEYSEPPEYSNSFFVYQPEEVEKIIPFSSPYPFVGGALEGESNDKIKIYFSDGKERWQQIYQGEAGKFSVDYSSFFNNGFGVPDKDYKLRFSTEEISNLKITSEVQTAPRSLPFLEKGKVNLIEFVDALGNENLEVSLQLGFTRKSAEIALFVS